MTDTTSSLKVTAPAKVNLFLHVVGKTDNGYHALQSLIAFADEGDIITITPSNEFKFSFDSTAEHLPTDENNLVICAAKLLASALDKDLNCHIHLTKNIPIGAGLGGGSSDAAAAIKGLLKFWDADINTETLNSILLSLGADVPSCYHATACYFENIGDVITPLKNFPALNALLIYPNQHSSTLDVFKQYEASFSTSIKLPVKFDCNDTLIDFLRSQKNDLEQAAISNIPAIQKLLNVLEGLDDCKLTRMTGSGSACFALFETAKQAHDAKHIIQEQFSDYWVKDVLLS